MHFLLKTFSKETTFIVIFIVKNDQKRSNKLIDCSSETFWNFIQGLKVASFYITNVLGSRWLSETFTCAVLASVVIGWPRATRGRATRSSRPIKIVGCQLAHLTSR